ncbi:MAG TPA: hypothetical protein VKJ65_06295, partial [Phycisphaerae bacterium]|nr:hypothetical protein [Phycisphaerae bacterium]
HFGPKCHTSFGTPLDQRGNTCSAGQTSPKGDAQLSQFSDDESAGIFFVETNFGNLMELMSNSSGIAHYRRKIVSKIDRLSNHGGTLSKAND